MVGVELSGEYYVLLWNTETMAITDQAGWELSQAIPSQDNRGLPCVAFELNPIGGSLMGTLTGNNINRSMAVVLDEQVYTAPNIESRITDSGIITGSYTQSELNYIIRTLNAGSLKAALSEEPIEVRTIQPTIGAENLARGMKAAFGALIAVAIFMMIYYFASGLVAGAALAANLIIILGMMAGLQATFTLPGIAGIVLTIGMCVDANVLVFERIREEMRDGADMLTALRLGYQKAFSSIIDGNLTNLIVCVILAYTASAEVRGFAVTLGIGICATLFSSLYMTHAIFDIFYKVLGAKKMNMLPMAVPSIEKLLRPNINWIDKRKAFFACSGVALVVSVLLVVSRGSDLLDIEFQAGTEVVFDLKEGQRLSVDEARERLEALENVEKDLENLTVVAVGDQTADYKASAFSVLTTNADAKSVAELVQGAFQDIIDNPPPLSFNHQGAEESQFKRLMYDVVFPVDLEDTSLPLTLGNVIGRPEITDPVDTHQGGVAILLDNLTPAATLEDVRDRIEKMRFQPDFAGQAYRQFDVIGVDTDPANPDLYKTVAVVSHDPNVSFFEDPEGWNNLLATKEWDLVSQALARETSLSKVTNFSPTVAETLRQQAIVALIFSCFAIVAYIWFRFGSLRYGLAAIAALVHDVTITLGLVAISGYIYSGIGDNFLLLEPFKINMGLIAALLTIIGYSLNDTIVLFDRIRENRGKLDYATPSVINGSINQVISRTMLTSFTTFMAVFLMYAFGGSGIHGFAFALTCGVIVGTYSSIAIASPMLLVGTKYAKANVSNATTPATT
ncbi:MAG: protein translocase subunit SecD, partial [Planctomycetota bacterium]|jgi:SecD/SecF fusion protein